jgi:WS/DGAT/MGAT family acyltransferase
MARERELAFSERMSDHEALMWNIEKDPWLNPSGSALTILDQPVDMDRFRRQLRYGVSKLPRLYQRVVPGLGRISTPAWAPDPEFDFDFHLREMVLPAPGTERQLFDLVAHLASEPMDRTRPLWKFVVISGLDDGRGAIWSIFHHAISDGIGQIRMAEMYQQLSRDEADHPEVDLEGIVAAACAEHDAKESGGDQASSLVNTATRSLTHLARRQIGVGRRALGEVMLWPVDPDRAVHKVTDTIGATKHTVGQLRGSGNETPGGSPLWKQRSRHRHLEYVSVPLEPLKAAAKSVGGSINDAFIAGLTDAAVDYHRARGVDVDAFNTSFVLSTRTDSKVGGNAFTPVLIQVSGEQRTPAERIREVHEATERARESASSGGGMSGLASVANLLPTSVVTKAARDQAAKIDFATSNLRGAPFELFCAGGKVLASIPLGPVAGTAANITALSYNGHFDMGIFLDPVAIDDPDDYRRCIEASFARITSLAGDGRRAATPAAKKSTAKRATKKKATKKKATATKSGKKKAAPKKAGAGKE